MKSEPTMKWHRNLFLAVTEALHHICNEGKYVDKALEKILKQEKRWGARDRAFIAETTYEIVRYKRLYEALANVSEPFSEAVLWRLVGVFFIAKGQALPPWQAFEGLSEELVQQRYQAVANIPKIKESVPDWLEERGMAELGESGWLREIAALNQPAAVVLRVNTLKITRESLQATLRQEGIETELPQAYPFALVLPKRANVFGTQAFKNGFFEVQDASSQLVAPFLDAQPGMRVIDACAGAGGKALHLATLMQNKGRIIALDVVDDKLLELKKRASRNGVDTIETRLIVSAKTLKRLRESADRVLIDAPCSGLGVLRRNPDTKWKLRPEFLEETISLQQQLLQEYTQMVKPGGKLVYATCSILPSENERQIAHFLQTALGTEFTLERENHVIPSESGFDGFYMALLRRKPEDSVLKNQERNG